MPTSGRKKKRWNLKIVFAIWAFIGFAIHWHLTTKGIAGPGAMPDKAGDMQFFYGYLIVGALIVAIPAVLIAGIRNMFHEIRGNF